MASILVTQYLVFLAWIPFRVRDFDQAIYSMQKYIIFDFQTNEIFSLISSYPLQFTLMGLFIALHFISYMKPNLISSISKLKIHYWAIFLTVIFMAIVFTYGVNTQPFIYFKF